MKDDIIVKVQCGNCGTSFMRWDLHEFGFLARDLHHHWVANHGTTNIHNPSTTVYRVEPLA